jgi:hypothetical protein
MMNPYETPHGFCDPAGGGRLRFDIGQLVGTYLQILAVLSVVSMLARLMLSHGMFIDLSFIFFYWAGVYLKRHSPTARKCVLGVSWLFVAAAIAMMLVAVFFGTKSMTVYIGIDQIRAPSIVEVFGVAALGVVLAGIPGVLLMTRRARNEFSPSCE